MSLALYRKYRPQNFREVIGQNHIKITLQNEIESGEISHAYLFCGPRGLGKTTLARLFAKAVNCERRPAGTSEPCGDCASCQATTENSNIDIIEIDAASHTGVDNVRENIIDSARFTPNKSKYKVFIIDEVHMLSTSAFNALLKTLEEPPAHAIFILCTTEIYKLPLTIISRCQRFDFKRVPATELLKRLEFLVKQEKKKVAAAVLDNIIFHSDGCVRDAESLLGKILTLGDNITLEAAELVLPRSDFSRVIDFVTFLREKNRTGAIALVNKLVEEGIDLQVFCDDLLEFLRQLLLIKTGGELTQFGIDLSPENKTAAEDLAGKLSDYELVNFLEIFLEKSQEIKNALIPQLPLELAVIKICLDDKNDHDKRDDGNGGASVKTKIKEKLSQLGRKKDDIPLENLAVAKEKEQEEQIKVDLLSDDNKVQTYHELDLKKIEASWPAIVEALLEKNFTLASLLKISQPFNTCGQILEIGVRSAFYKKCLDEFKNKRIIEAVISEVIKNEVVVLGVVRDDLKPLEFVPTEPTLVVKDGGINKINEAKIISPKPAGDVVADVISMF